MLGVHLVAAAKLDMGVVLMELLQLMDLIMLGVVVKRHDLAVVLTVELQPGDLVILVV